MTNFYGIILGIARTWLIEFVDRFGKRRAVLIAFTVVVALQALLP